MITIKSQPLLEYLVEPEGRSITRSDFNTFLVCYPQGGVDLTYRCTEFGGGNIEVYLFYPPIKSGGRTHLEPYYTEDFSSLIEQGLARYHVNVIETLRDYFTYAFDKALNPRRITYCAGDTDLNYTTLSKGSPFFEGWFERTKGKGPVIAGLAVYFNLEQPMVTVELLQPDGQLRESWEIEKHPSKIHYPRIIDKIRERIGDF